MYTIMHLPASDWANYNQADPMVQNLVKSIMEAGTGVDAGLPFTGGRALMMENLDDVLQVVTTSMEEASLWRMLPKRSIWATIDQYNRETSFGNRWGRATTESGSPSDNLAVIARAYENVRHYRDIRKISIVDQAVRSVTDPAQVQERAATETIIKGLAEDLYWANSALPLRCEGLISKLMTGGFSVPIEDLNGKVLSGAERFEWLTAEVRSQGGKATHALLPPLLAADFSAVYDTAKRITITPGATGDGRTFYGAEVGGIVTAQGRLNFEIDIFNLIGWAAPTAAQGDGPAAPTFNSATPGGTGGTIPTGNYYYKVTAVNENGESVVATQTVTAVTLGQKVTITVTPNDAITTGFRVYRSAKDASDNSDCRFLWQFAWDGSGATSWVDDGTFVPGCGFIPVVDMSPNHTALQWSQLMPLSKLPFSRIGFYDWFGVNLSGAFRVARPEFLGIVANVLAKSHRDAGWDPLGHYTT